MKGEEYLSVNVLVVEDDEPIAVALVNGLRRAGFDAESVGSAAGALNALPTDFILLYLGLPDRDGVELFHNLRAVTNAPIIMVTARGTEQDRIAGLDLGADDYVVKPFGVREIGALRIGLQLGEGARHAGEPELVHLVEGRMGQHDQASSMVVAGAADVGMVGQQLALPSSSGRLLVEPMLEDRLDRSVGTGADVEAAVASRFQPTGAVLAA